MTINVGCNAAEVSFCLLSQSAIAENARDRLAQMPRSTIGAQRPFPTQRHYQDCIEKSNQGAGVNALTIQLYLQAGVLGGIVKRK